MAKRGRPRKTITEDDLQRLEAMASAGCTMQQCAQILNISQRTLERRASATFQAGKANMIANAGRTAVQMALGQKDAQGRWIKEPSERMLIFVLKTQAKWSERIELEHTGSQDEEGNAAHKRIESRLDKLAEGLANAEAEAESESE